MAILQHPPYIPPTIAQQQLQEPGSTQQFGPRDSCGQAVAKGGLSGRWDIFSYDFFL